MGQLHPQHLKASHLSLVPSLPPPPIAPFAFLSFVTKHLLGLYTSAEKVGLERTQDFQKNGMGYYALRTTKPQTVRRIRLAPEEVCTCVSLYWFSTAGPAASLRIYYESQRGAFLQKLAAMSQV
ncbi:epoxide hydrolase [Paraphaeosphaeria sporulosa]